MGQSYLNGAVGWGFHRTFQLLLVVGEQDRSALELV